MHKHVFDAQKINPFEGVHHAGARLVGGSKDKAVRRREIEAAEDKIHIRSLQHRIARLDEDIRLEKVPVLHATSHPQAISPSRKTHHRTNTKENTNSRGAEQDAQQKIKMVHTELAMKKVSCAIKTSIKYFFRTYSSHERELIHTGIGKILCQAQLRGTRYLLSMFSIIFILLMV